MKKFVKIAAAVLCAAAVMSVCTLCIFAAQQDEASDNAADTVEIVAAPEENGTSENGTSENGVVASKSTSAAIIIAVASGVGAIAMAIAVYKAVDSTARQPEAAGGIRTTMMMGLVFIETAIIYALIVAILVIFVL